jgi:hypothetical protein
MSVLTMPLNQSALQHLAAAQTADSSSTNGNGSITTDSSNSSELPKLLLVTKGAPESVCKACDQTTLPAGYHARCVCIKNYTVIHCI